MKTIRVVFGKRGGRPHREYDAFHLGDDAYGTWLGLPAGIAVDTCEAVRRADQLSEPPVDGPAAQRWLQGLDEAMMLR